MSAARTVVSSCVDDRSDRFKSYNVPMGISGRRCVEAGGSTMHCSAQVI